MRLTRGEGWWLLRRRAHATQSVWASRLRISEDRLRRWEHDKEAAPMPGGIVTEHTALTPGEYSALARRRVGRTLEECARTFGISRQTLIKQEHDRTASSTRLARAWSICYPGPHRAAPIRLSSPAL